MIKLYGVPSCNQIRKSKALLDEHGIEYEFIHVKKNPVSAEKLKMAVDQLGLDRVLNSKGPTFRKLGLKDKQLDDKALFDWLLKEQGMIKRPLIEKDGKFHVGYDEEEIINFVK